MEHPEHNPGEPAFGDHAEDAPHNPGEPIFGDEPAPERQQGDAAQPETADDDRRG